MYRLQRKSFFTFAKLLLFVVAFVTGDGLNGVYGLWFMADQHIFH